MSKVDDADDRIPPSLGRSELDFSKIRDAAFVLGGFLYIIGYATWSVFSWRTRLGPIPALDTQYFVAGTPVVAVILAVGFILRSLLLISIGRWPAFVESLDKHRRHLMLQSINIGLIIAGAFLVLFAGHQNYAMTIARRFAFAVGLTLFLLIAASRLRRRRAGLLAFAAIFWMYMYLSGFGNSALGWFIERGYRSIPQALGGAKPRRAVLDLKVAELAPGTLAALAPAQGRTAAVVTSRQVWVLARLGDSFFVAVTDPDREKSTDARYELRSGSVSAITWRD